MPNHEPLKKGQEVFITRPVHIYANVLDTREGKFGLPQEEVAYGVRLQPLKQYYRLEDLEPSDTPELKPTGRLDYMSAEWIEEPTRFNNVAGRWLVNKSDTDLARQVSESLVKLGFLI